MNDVKIARVSKFLGTIALTAAATVLTLRAVGADFSPLASQPAYRQFMSTYRLLTTSYYRQVDPNELIHGMISGMMDTLHDPFSQYMNPAMTARFREMVSSHFQGIGAVLSYESGQIVISSVLPGSPADRAGVRSGDILTQVNGSKTDGMSLLQVVERIRGQVGSYANLTLLRGSATLHIRVQRANLHQSTVYAKMFSNHIGYILITQFSEDTASAFARDLSILKQEGARGLILDVRDDPGGLLSSVGQIANDLLARGKTIVEVESRNHQIQALHATGSGIKLPMVCLINGNSASAAEILAAALHDSGGVPLIGERTYGKGTVQETQEFADGSSLKLTVAKWLTPKGTWIHHVGIAPSMYVATPAFYHLPPLPMTLRRPYALDQSSVSIAVLQRMLLALGYNPGRTDGYYSVQTEQAVTAFQKMHGLKSTGTVSDATAYALNVALLKIRVRDDPAMQTAIGYLDQKLGG
ncbi:S41 family peptidase [Ferroacidibacillus organovorans]|uniref:S41 family peptidase n=1 Tax=Ferroacidibacillus organovorans TaxID=1765683 RepID=UPI001177E7D8|nr:S41 family peptidase [Ferroacidibacillus organovorans]